MARELDFETPARGPARVGARHGRKRRGASNTTPKRDTNACEFIGVDGEGVGRKDHKYILLAASNEDGSWGDHIENEKGLGTIECLEFLLSLPKKAKTFAFSFGYDLTKILTDLPNKILYILFRPDLRPGQYGPRAVTWGPYSLNLVGNGSGKFTIKKGSKRRVIWDVWRFYSTKFVNALKDWNGPEYADAKWHELEKLPNLPPPKLIPLPELLQMQRMKEQRSEFEHLSRDEIRKYCFSECSALARLVRLLVKACEHESVDLELTSFYGAGSVATAILKPLGIEESRGKQPAAMRRAIASAFFGGRFENAIVGLIKEPLQGWDISSAYPYQITFLPCMQCGKWAKVKRRKDIDKADAACVRYRLPPPKGDSEPWSPFPYRDKDGSIFFPEASPGGWVWKEEFLMGEKYWPRVEFREAWIYTLPKKCRHQPFFKVPTYYIARVKLGKDGPGIILKLGPNSIYGKLAQSLGNAPPFQQWVWAGMITSNTRAQILEMIGLHKDRANVLSIATDGIVTRETIKPPLPRETGTRDLKGPDGKPAKPKPLGGWEAKHSPRGQFFARPGLNTPPNPTFEELAEVRARGLGRSALQQGYKQLYKAFLEGTEIQALKKGKIQNVKGVELVLEKPLAMFHGAKTSVHMVKCKRCKAEDQVGIHLDCPHLDQRIIRSEMYGQWSTRPSRITFEPLPKREGLVPVKGEKYSLMRVRRVEGREESRPYDAALPLSDDAKELRAEDTILSEQADVDYQADWED